MTLFITDVSRYQVERPDALDLAKAKAVGIGAVNIALDRGQREDVLSPWALEYAEGARSLDLGISTYRWLDNRLSGHESALRAVARMRELGGPHGMAHVVDCEDNATETILRDYLSAVQDMLQRPVAVYTGAWWWSPRGWRVSDLTPLLWAAPGTGYPGTYPGDESRLWQAGYGGWPVLSAMQYAVAPLPGTGPCSLSAIRDPSIWAALTGEVVKVDWFLNRALSNFRAAVNARYPNRDKASDGTIGDRAHAASVSDHNPDPDGSVDAWDMDTDLNGTGRPATADVEALKVVFQAHPSSRYWIHNRQIATRANGWRRADYTGDSPHLEHVHWNTDQSRETSDAAWVLPTKGDDDMKTIFYDGTAYWVGDGVTRRAVQTWPEMMLIQAAGRAGTLSLYKNGEIVNTTDARTYGVAVDETPDLDAATAGKLTESVQALAERLAAADNGLPADPAVIERAVRESVEDLAGKVLKALEEGT